MTCENLATAGERLASAAESASDPDDEQTLANVGEQLDRLAASDQGPDHGRLARIEAKLRDVSATEGTEVAAAVEQALAEIHDCRETLEGV